MPDKELKALIDLIQFHMSCHQNLTERDVYKLLYQGIMGPKHLLGNPEAAKEYLRREWEAVKPDKEEPLTEPVSTDGLVLRVNIRPCRKLTGNFLLLWEALYQSAIGFNEDIALFKNTWQEFYHLVQGNRLPFSLKKIAELDGQAKKDNYPSMNHSREYNMANKPAYRLLVREELEKIDEYI